MFFSLCEYIAFVCILYFHIRFLLCALSISVLCIPTVTAIMTPLQGKPSTAAFISKHQRILFICHAYLMLVHNYSSEVILPCVDFSEDILMSLFHARLYLWHISNTVTFTVCITIHCSPLTTWFSRSHSSSTTDWNLFLSSIYSRCSRLCRSVYHFYLLISFLEMRWFEMVKWDCFMVWNLK
jgi:hypothetical protein